MIKYIKNNKLAKESSKVLILKVTGIAILYFFTIFLTRGYGAETTGLFFLSLTILMIISTFTRLGLDTAMLKYSSRHYSSKEKGLLQKIYVKSIIVSSILSLIASIFLYFFANNISIFLLKDTSLTIYLQACAIIIVPFALLFINAETLRGLGKPNQYTFLKNISYYGISLIVLLFLFFTDSSWTVIFSFSTGVILSTVISFFMLKDNFESKFKTKKQVHIKEILSVSLPMLLASSFFLILEWADRLMLGYYESASLVGIYSIAIKVATLTGLSLFSINTITAAKFSKMHSLSQKEGLKRFTKMSTNLVFYTSLPIALLLILFPGFFLSLFGSEFIAGEAILIILVIGQLINSLCGSVGYLMQMTNHQLAFQNIVLLAACLNIILNFVLIPPLGGVGAALATSFSMIFWNVTAVIFIKLKLGFWTIYDPFFRE